MRRPAGPPRASPGRAVSARTRARTRATSSGSRPLPRAATRHRPGADRPRRRANWSCNGGATCAGAASGGAVARRASASPCSQARTAGSSMMARRSRTFSGGACRWLRAWPADWREHQADKRLRAMSREPDVTCSCRLPDLLDRRRRCERCLAVPDGLCTRPRRRSTCVVTEAAAGKSLLRCGKPS